jgi:hypothetical protein
VDLDWRPYSDGRWLYTDAGWTWDSDEPYSWAVYHYGRWARVDRIGWIWVPGTEWGPAWVSWRRSPRYVGWAPLPPDAEFSRSVGFNARVDADYDIGPTNYSFVQVRNFGAPRLRTVIVEPRENITIISQTTNITRITYVNNVVYNEGPNYDVISRESAQPIRRLKLERREELDGVPGKVRAEQLRMTVEGDSLRVLAIPFDTRPATVPRKVAARVEKAEVDHGWKNAGPPAEVARLRTKIKSEPATTAEALPQPRILTTKEAPASAAGKPDAVPPSEKSVKIGGENAGESKGATVPIAPKATPASFQKVDTTTPEKFLPVDKTAARERLPNAAEPGKFEQRAIPANTDTSRLPTSNPAAHTSRQPQAEKDELREIETARPPADASPKVHAPMRKKEGVEPAGKLPPTAVETPRAKLHPGKADTQPRPDQPAARSIERAVPNNPEPHPQAGRPERHQQPASATGTSYHPAAATRQRKSQGQG